MGTFHPNITDKAVLNRVQVALQKGVTSLDFEVPKAKKKFKLTIVTGKHTSCDVYHTSLASFTFHEVT